MLKFMLSTELKVWISLDPFVSFQTFKIVSTGRAKFWATPALPHSFCVVLGLVFNVYCVGHT